MMNDEEKSQDRFEPELTAFSRRVVRIDMKSHFEDLQTKREFKSSENKYRIILDNMEEAYFELDLKGNFTFFNEATKEMLGYSVDELAQVSYRDYLPSEARIMLVKKFNEIYRKGESGDVLAYQIIRKDGSKRFREMSASLIRDSEQIPIGFRCLARDVTKKRLVEESLKKKEKELKKKSASLAEVNVALKVLLKQREEDKVALERSVLSNVREIIMPYIEKLKKGRLTPSQNVCINTIEINLANIISPFLRNITVKHSHLTPREFQVADLVKEGRTTKEIAEFLNVSTGTIDCHRNNIREKLALNNKKLNLRSYLSSLS